MGFPSFLKSWKGIALITLIIGAIVTTIVVLTTQSDSSSTTSGSNEKFENRKDNPSQSKTESPSITTKKPTIDQKTTENPTTENPTTENPTTENPTTLSPILSLPLKQPNTLNLGKKKCPSKRSVKTEETVFLTIDDGPQYQAREHLLNVLKEINVGVSFFDCGYRVCNDLDVKVYPVCETFAYDKNIELLSRTVKEGHFLGAHSDNHYINSNGQCQYENVEPTVRPISRKEKCGLKPLQNMVQGSHQLQLALESKKIEWKTTEEQQLRNLALEYIWTYGRLPCTEIWRTHEFNKTRIPGVTGTEFDLRVAVADELSNGPVKCRPKEYQNKKWELYGWDAHVDWKHETILEPNEVCRMFREIEIEFDRKKEDIRQKKVVLLTHDHYFDTLEKAKVFQELTKELIRHGYKLDTMDHYF